MIMRKQYVLKAFTDFDTPYKYYVGFQYDSEFFNDILEIISDNSVSSSLSFPMDSDFFELYEYASKSSIFDGEMLNQMMFAPSRGPKTIKKQFKKLVPRLHVFNDTFHFTVKSQNGTLFHTEDLNIKFIDNLTNYYQAEYLEMVP